MSALRQLWPFVRPYRGVLIFGAFIALANNAIGVIGPWLIKLAIDALTKGTTLKMLAIYAGLFVLVFLAAGVLHYLLRQVLIGMSRHVELDLRNAIFAHLQTLPSAYYNRNRTGDIMARLTSDLEAVRMVLGPGIMYPLDTISMAGFVIGMMIVISPKLTLAVCILAPFVSLTVFFLGRITYRLHTRIQEQFSTLSARAEENLAGVRIVRAFAQEPRELARFDELHREYVKRNLAMVRVQAAFMPTMFFLFEVGTALILLLGGRGIIGGELTLGDFVAFVGYLGMLAWPMIAVGWVANLFQRGSASMKRLSQILETESEITQPVAPRAPSEIRGQITFENVGFHYDEGIPALSNLNFNIEAGKTVAIVGRTGSGKTTLISLIPRLYDSTSGRVLIDGIPTTEWDLKTLRDSIGVVPQEALLFSDSLRANIEFGTGDTGDDAFRTMAEVAQMAKDVESFREGYDTVVGERGLTLSGGQKGRTAIARALVKNPKILILDDALAAVDTQTEEQILSGLREFMKDRTSVIISHRVSTVKYADEILVLDHGCIVERGTHDELLALGGYYAELERMQRLEAELEELEEDSPA